MITGDVHWEMGLCNQCWNVYRHEKMPIPQYVDILHKEIYELQNENLKQQLAEKEKEIAYLRERNFYKVSLKNEESLGIYPKNMEKIIRHQVCEEIRKAFLTELELPNEEWVWYSDNYAGVSLIKKILEQIEGEKND